MTKNENVFKKFNNAVEEGHSLLKDILNRQPNKVICTDKSDNDIIFGYVFIDDILYEKQVKGIKLEDDNIFVLLDEPIITYDIETIMSKDFNSEWYQLLGGELLGRFTLINIIELIDEYV